MAGNAQARPQGLIRLVPTSLARLAAILVIGALTALAAGGVEPPVASAQTACPVLPTGLAPSGPARFTMLIRINQQENVNTYVNRNEATGGLGGRIQPQDIFVLNTRFETMTPAIANQLATNLRASFPCNRIIGLNGMSFNPLAPGYAFSLIDHPAVWGLMTDFEPSDWNGGQATDPGRPGWNGKYSVALPRIRTWMGRLSGALASNPAYASKRAGLVPLDISTWNYGEVAQAIDKKNARLGGRHLGPLSVQTQDHCANGGASSFGDRAAAIFDTYRYKFVKKKVFKKGKKRKITVRRKIKKKARPLRNNLSMQISFSPTPNPNAGMAITKTSAAQAAACTQAALDQGQGAFFYFASDDAMRLLFFQPQIAAMRPAPPPVVP